MITYLVSTFAVVEVFRESFFGDVSQVDTLPKFLQITVFEGCCCYVVAVVDQVALAHFVKKQPVELSVDLQHPDARNDRIHFS